MQFLCNYITCSILFESAVRKPEFQFPVTDFHLVKPTIVVHFKNIFSWCEWGKLNNFSSPSHNVLEINKPSRGLNNRGFRPYMAVR